MNAVVAVAIGRLAVASICAAGSAYLAIHGITGWGWFLFAAIWLGAITASDSKNKKEVEE